MLVLCVELTKMKTKQSVGELQQLIPALSAGLVLFSGVCLESSHHLWQEALLKYSVYW